MRKSIYLLFSIILLIGILAACGSKSNQTATNGSDDNKKAESNSGNVWKRIQDSGVLRVGFEGTYPPFNYQDDKGDFIGFDVDISKEIASRLGIKAEFVTSKWAGLIGGLNADKFDVIIAQMSITDERKKSVDFTNPYVITGAVIVTNKDTNNIKTLDDLKGKKVGAAAGTSFAEVAQKAKNADVKLYDGGFTTYVNDVVNKRLDALINDSLVMGYNIKESGLPIKVTSELLSRDENAMAIKKGNEDFVQKMNKAISEIKEDGTYEKIYKKWFGMKPIK